MKSMSMTIDPEALRKNLGEVWAALSREAAADGHEVTRACSLTLIAVVDDDGEAESISEVLGDLMQSYPSRDIVLRLAPGQTDLLDANVDARCWKPHGQQRQICSEQIVIRCSDTTLVEVPAVVESLIVPDLPVVLWCASARVLDSPAFSTIARLAGHIVLDSFSSPDPLRALASLRRGVPDAALVSDLSWTRLTRWRALLAQVFENKLYRRQTPQLDELVIHYECSEEHRVPPTALLLAGWVAACLSWDGVEQRDEESASELRLQRASGWARVVFEGHAASVRPGRLLSFSLSSHGENGVRISIARSSLTCGEVRIDLGGAEPVISRVSLPRSTPLLLLGEELGAHRRDTVFEHSLGRALQIGERLK